MTFKSQTQPFCRWCGKRIRKDTNSVYFGGGMAGTTPRARLFPTSTEEAQREVNGNIVSLTWERQQSDYGIKRNDGRPYIDKVTVWDGESYVDEFFCTGACARRMGYSACRHHSLVTDAWRKATGRKP